VQEIGKTFIIAAAGGAIFSLAKVPLPWMLGPIAIVAAYNYFTKKEKLNFSVKIRNTALLAFGYTMGRPFTHEAAQAIWDNLPLMITATTASVAMGLAAGFYTNKKTGINLESCLMGCVPGGLTQMLALADEVENVDTAAVTIMQTVRMLSVIFIIPFIATYVVHDGDATGGIAGGEIIITWQEGAVLTLLGAWTAKKMKLPTPPMIGPLLFVAAYLIYFSAEAPAVPSFVIDFCQICLGSYIGAKADLRAIKKYHSLKRTLFFSVGLVLGGALLLGLMLVWKTGMTMVTAFLSTSPGGLSEMGVTGLAVGADMAVLTAYQLARLLFIMLIVPYILKGVLKFYNQSDKNKIS
jgi:hypothetical protein